MSNILYVSGTDRLARCHAYDKKLPLGDVSLQSLEGEYWYIRSTQQKRASDAGDELVMPGSEKLQREPSKIQRWVTQRRDFEDTADWMLQSRDIWRAILLYQVEKKTAFYQVFTDELKQFEDPARVSIVATSAAKGPPAMIWTAGCKKSFCEQLRRDGLPYPGMNLWGKLLEELAQHVYTGVPMMMRFGVKDLLGKIIEIHPSHPYTALLVTDSQFKRVSKIEMGTCLPIGGATFGDMVDRLIKDRIRLDDFHMVIFFGGINDCQREDWIKERSLDKLHRFLCVDNQNYLKNGDVLVCPTFQTPVVPKSYGYASWVSSRFAGSPVKVVEWNRDSSFVVNNRVVKRLFDPPKYFHLNGTGIREAYKVLASRLPALAMVHLYLRESNPSQSGPSRTYQANVQQPCSRIQSSAVVVQPGSRKRRMFDHR